MLAPRLDVNFKYNPAIQKIPKEVGPTPVGRQPWNDFINCVEKMYVQKGYEFEKVEMALWQFNTKMIKNYSADYVFIPHKEHHNLGVKEMIPQYYMQTTFPWIFTVDTKGWAGGASVYPYDSLMPDTTDSKVFNSLRDRALNNKSKFEQPDYKQVNLPDDYVLFACQIPHDETIKYHSKVGVGKALIYTCEATKKLGIPLVVKGHPMNPDSMIGLKNSLKSYTHVTWLEKVSIHQLIEKSKCVVVVNSGVGMEALLHKKPVVTFGQAEYDCVTNHATKETIEQVLTNLVYDEDRVIRFFDGWYHWAYDTTDISTFSKLP
jgi:hypothetical protein